MSLPKQVQALADEADRLEKELVEASQAQAGATEEAPAVEEPTTEAPEGVVEETGEQVETPVETAPEPEPHKSEDAQWESRYKTLQGMFNAEVPRLRSEVEALKSQLEAVAKAAPKAEAEERRAERLVTDQDVADFGDDLVDLIKRQATEVARTEVARLEDENAQLRDQLGSVESKQGDFARQTYFADLAKLVPDYEAINVDERFLGWLSEVDTFSGVPRQEYLNTAFNGYDVARTAALFQGFKELTGSPEQAKAPPKELRRQVAPGTSKSSVGSPTATNEKVWSMAEIDRFYKDVARGVYRGNDTEQARIEADIDLAVQEGRLSR